MQKFCKGTATELGKHHIKFDHWQRIEHLRLEKILMAWLSHAAHNSGLLCAATQVCFFFNDALKPND